MIIRYDPRLAGVDQLTRVASYTVLMHNGRAFFPDVDHLRFFPQRENRGMAQSVLGLETIRVEKMIVRYMTVVAVRPLPVGTVTPRRVLRSHNVAVDTRRRIVAEVRMRFRKVHGQ